ncbi:MAG: TRZ/ATZ family hydrolase [Pseudomonadota bacterium]
MSQIDLLIDAAWVAPVEPDERVLENHSVAVDKGQIVAVLPTERAHQRYRAETHRQLSHHLLIPGLINAHGHAAMSLFRGLADDLPLMTWLQEHIWPAEGQWVSDAFVAEGTRLAMAEMLRSGTTCFSDMYFFPDVVAREARRIGMRASVGLILIDFPTVWAENPDAYLRKGIEVHDAWRHDSLISTFFAPHAPYTVSDGPLQQARMMADELNIPIQMHVHETAGEVADAESADGRRPLARLDDLGLLSPQFMAVHMTQLTDAEIERLAATGSHVIHCPESNMKLASGICPVQALLNAGINVALGTDGAASNNDLDMIGEMRSAALLGKLPNEHGPAEATAVSAHQVLKMATLGGARALGLEEHCGSLVAGKSADIAAIDLGQLATQPVYDPVSQLVYAASRDQVSDVWVQGRPQLTEGRLDHFNTRHLMESAGEWRQRIQSTDQQREQSQ